MNRPLRWSWIAGPFLIMISPFIFLFICLVLAGYVVHEIGRPREWVQVREVCKWRSGDKLISESYFYNGGLFSTGSTPVSDNLYVQWANGEKEQLTMRRSSRGGLCCCSTNGDLYAIAYGADLFYRAKSPTPGHWNTWKLTTTQNIYDFIKKYLDDHYTNSYGPYISEFAPPPGAFEIKCNHLGEEQPLRIVPQRDLPYGIKEILNGGHDLVAVPDRDNPYAPILIFSQNKEVPGWHLNKRETLRRNKDRK